MRFKRTKNGEAGTKVASEVVLHAAVDVTFESRQGGDEGYDPGSPFHAALWYISNSISMAVSGHKFVTFHATNFFSTGKPVFCPLLRCLPAVGTAGGFPNVLGIRGTIYLWLPSSPATKYLG